MTELAAKINTLEGLTNEEKKALCWVCFVRKKRSGQVLSPVPHGKRLRFDEIFTHKCSLEAKILAMT